MSTLSLSLGTCRCKRKQAKGASIPVHQLKHLHGIHRCAIRTFRKSQDFSVLLFFYEISFLLILGPVCSFFCIILWNLISCHLLGLNFDQKTTQKVRCKTLHLWRTARKRGTLSPEQAMTEHRMPGSLLPCGLSHLQNSLPWDTAVDPRALAPSFLHCKILFFFPHEYKALKSISASPLDTSTFSKWLQPMFAASTCLSFYIHFSLCFPSTVSTLPM